MATLEEIISDALEFIDRPDLLDVARRTATEVLYKCHRSGDYSRDLVYGASETVDTNSSTTRLTLPDRFRKLAGIAGATDSGLPLSGYAPESMGIAAPIGYAGLRSDNDRYRIAGNQLTLFHYQLIRPASVQLAYFSYPAVTIALDSTVTTDSWMLAQFPDVVRWRFIMQLASVTSNKDMQAVAAAQYAESIAQLQANELVDLPEHY